MKIKDVQASLREAFIDWKHFLMLANYTPRDEKDSGSGRVLYREVTWFEYNSDYRIAQPVTQNSISDCVKTKQFTYITEDHSIFQLYYRFDRHGELLTNASLGFYLANSHKRVVDEDTIENEISVLPVEMQESTLSKVFNYIDNHPVGWIRIDYDPTAKERGIVHHDCHMHLSNFPHTRFIVSGVPTPRQFVEFVISAVYPEVYKVHCLELKIDEEKDTGIWQYRDGNRIKTVNNLCMPLKNDPVYDQLSHLRIPSS